MTEKSIEIVVYSLIVGWVLLVASYNIYSHFEKEIKTFMKKEYSGNLVTTWIWLIPLILGVSISKINQDATVYALHITPWFEIGFNWRHKK